MHVAAFGQRAVRGNEVNARFVGWLALLAVLDAASAVTASAASWPDDGLATKVVASAQTQYMVSAVLRKGLEGVQIKLVHSRLAAGNADEATGIFLRRVLREYAGYSVLDTLTSEVDSPSSFCPRHGGFDVVRSFKPGASIGDAMPDGESGALKEGARYRIVDHPGAGA
jgi:hypothetical protein